MEVFYQGKLTIQYLYIPLQHISTQKVKHHSSPQTNNHMTTSKQPLNPYASVIIAILFILAPHCSFATVPDSITRNLEDYDFLTSFTEENYAAFPAIMEMGYKKKYETLKKRLRKQVVKGKKDIEQAVCDYAIWFHRNFDTHYSIENTTLWDSYVQSIHTDYTKVMEYNPQPVSCKVDEQTWLVRVPSCTGENPTAEWVQQAAKQYEESGCENLIIDVRGNGGGNDGIWWPFLQLIVDHQRERPLENFFRNTLHNQKYWEFLLEQQMGDSVRSQQFLEQCKQSLGKNEFERWSVWDASDINPTLPPKCVAIIADNQSASAAEGLIQIYAKGNSNRTKFYGKERTYGAELTGNLFYTKLPHADIYLVYPTCIKTFEFLKDSSFGKIGIEPDVHIPLAYPERLTDNIDEWVLWIAKEMKK